MRVLLCDDEPLLRDTLSDDIEDAGHSVKLAADGVQALERISLGDLDCVVTDLAMPGAGGMEVLAAARQAGLDVVMITGHGSIGTAVEAMRAGAYDFLEKPFPGDALIRVLAHIGEKRLPPPPGTAGAIRGFARVIGGVGEKSRLMLEAARRAAASDASLLIVGESGSGKEVLAKAIHEESARRKRPFVPVSCGAISPQLLDDELFGHEKGAFTDAKTSRIGCFEEAEGGTLLLDDIDDMRPDTQVKLLRVLQEREIRRLGSEKSIRVDIRVVAASKVDLERHVANGRFRTDLLYRLQVLRLEIPPLRERMEDIPDLLRHFLAKHASGRAPSLDPETAAALAAQPWPGNIRQLENAVCRALAMNAGKASLSTADFLPGGTDSARESTPLTLASAVRKAEKNHIEKILALCGGNRSKTARMLGISRKNLWEKMRLLAIEEGE
ncbi:MAG: sigma-54 dependent transcriptional regulator [Planctomycetota bacterium]|jgi:DNA-binding NtrC family response regulator|nr:sigma-54 dependent transcriptional regulator [Planctomycetota bacterium]